MPARKSSGREPGIPVDRVQLAAREDSKLTRAKINRAHDGRAPAEVPTGHARLPPGQQQVSHWPILDLGDQPDIAHAAWSLEVFGAVASPKRFDWNGFQALAQSDSTSDIHCVTQWSRYDNLWTGVSTQALAAAVQPAPQAKFVLLHAYDRYTTNLLIEDFLADGAMIAHSWQGKPLTREHGAPARLVVPHLYFWKSAKWIQRIEFRTSEAAGFWEQRGYHNRGDPWKQERYSGK